MVGVVVDLIEGLVVEVADVHRVARCSHCGFLTTAVHDLRRMRVRDLTLGGRPTLLVAAAVLLRGLLGRSPRTAPQVHAGTG